MFEPEFDPVTINVFDQPWKPVVLKTFFSLLPICMHENLMRCEVVPHNALLTSCGKIEENIEVIHVFNHSR